MVRVSKLLVFFLLAASVTMAQPGKKNNRKEFKNVLKEAKEHLRYEEFNQAIPAVEELLKEDPNSAYYNFWMGKCLYITYKKNKALPFFRKVEKTNPDVDSEFHYYYGLTLHYNLNYDKAISEYRKDLNRYEAASPEFVWVSNRISQCNYAKKLTRKKDSEQVDISNMGSKINTSYSEHSPVISANDSLLIYTARRPECLGAKPESYFYDEDIYISKRNEAGEWSEAVNIDRPVNSKGHDATISLTAEGTKLFLYRHKKAGGLYQTDFDTNEQKWKEPRAIKKPLNSKYYEASICQSADSSIMFFTSDRPGGYGGRDIYMVRSMGGEEWTEPMNVGPTINTPFDEDAPYFHPDGRTLYFSSNGPTSMGGFDIFVTEMDSTAEGGWLAPLNMGVPVNTADDDIYFVLSADGKSGYYSSGKEGGYGEKDIYQIDFPYYPYPRRYHIVELAGLIQDVQTLDTLSALVKLVDNTTSEVLDSMYTGLDSANFYFILEPERSYSLEVVSDGYNPASADLETPTLEDEDLYLEKNLFLDKPKEEVVVVEKVFPEIQHIYYDFDQDDLRDGAPEELDMVAQVLEQNPDMDLRIMAHTDWFGTYDYNVDLSMRRAIAAYDYLVNERKIDPSRIQKGHFSENTPISTNEEDTGRQYNRRSEFQFVQNDQVLFRSVRLRTGVEGIAVDKTTPKGDPGFDNPGGGSSLAGTGSSSPDTEGDEGDTQGNPTVSVVKPSKEDREPVTVEPKTELEVSPSESDALAAAALANPSLVNAEGLPAGALNTLGSMELHHIYFDFDKYNLRLASKPELAKVIELVNTYPDLTLEVYGHTDAFGSVSYNQRLSENRAKETYDYFTGEGISESQIVITGFSELQPMDTNDDSKGRQNNRRVEFRLVKDGKVLIKSTP